MTELLDRIAELKMCAAEGRKLLECLQRAVAAVEDAALAITPKPEASHKVDDTLCPKETTCRSGAECPWPDEYERTDGGKCRRV